MGRFLLTTVTAAFAAIMLSGCMTAAFAPTSADVQSYAIKSVSMSGVAPQAVADAVSADLASAIRATSPKPGAAPVQIAVAISGFSGSRAATGYKAGADVTVTLKPSAGGKILQTASFHEDAVSVDEARATSQLAAEIAARVRRNFSLPVAQASTASNVPRPSVPGRKAVTEKPAMPDKASSDPALSSDALETLMRAAAGSDSQQDQTKTGSVPSQTVPVPGPEAACTGESLAACPQGSLLSGDFSLRK